VVDAAVCRVESALQQNEIMDVFFDDWAALTVDDGSFGSKADNHLKVCHDCVQVLVLTVTMTMTICTVQ